jgi:4-hydroxy-3-methylbut-2-enyl diphosphate reductase
MKILVAETAGFCWGVRRALDQAVDLAKKTDGPVQTFGPLIHNAQVMEELTDQNIHALEQVEDVRGGPVLVRAHGVRPEVFDQLRATGAEVFDATCPLVRKVQKIITKYEDQEYDIVIVGDDHHAEVVGLRGYARDRCYVVADENEADQLPEFDKVCVVSQTTQNDGTFDRVVEKVREKARVVRAMNTVCEPTRDHQTETIDLAKRVDLMVVVGGHHSANTCRLATLAEDEGAQVLHIETDGEITEEQFQDCNTIGVTAGASTPEWMINRVVEKIESFNREPASRLHTLVKKAAAFIVATNVYVGVGAAALTLATTLLLNPATASALLLSLMIIAGFHVLATHSIGRYGEHSYYSGQGTLSPTAHKRFQKMVMGVGIVAMGVSLGLAAFLGPIPLLVVLAAGLLSSLYGVKVIPLRWARHVMGVRRIKDLPASKDISSALGWTLVVGVLPLVSVGTSSWLRALGALAFVFLLVFVRSALLGVRDAQGDKIMGMETIFRVVGKRRTKEVLITLTAALTLILFALTLPWRGLPLAVFLLAVVPYVCGGSWSYHRRLLPKGAAGELLVDGQFLLAGFMTLWWRMYS